MRDVLVEIVLNWWSTAEGVTTVVTCVVGGIVSIIGAIAGIRKIHNKRKCCKHDCKTDKKKK